MKTLSWQDVVLSPVVTEKRNAIESLFKVGVTDVRTARYPGKGRRVGRYLGNTGSWKKAVVRVKEGDTIDFY